MRPNASRKATGTRSATTSATSSAPLARWPESTTRRCSPTATRGLALVQTLNPKGSPFIQAMCRSSAKLEATEDRALVEESSDWQRCLSIGLMSSKVRTLAIDFLREITAKRYERVSARIDETLQEGEVGALFASEDHRIQFPADVQVFYVAPPSLDALKRWLNDQMRPPAPGPEPGAGTADAEASGSTG